MSTHAVERGRLPFVDAKLHDRNVRLRVHVAQNRPRAVVEPPLVIQPHGHRGKQLLGAKRKLRIAGRGVLCLFQP